MKRVLTPVSGIRKLLARSRAIGIEGDKVVWWTDQGLEFTTSLDDAAAYGCTAPRKTPGECQETAGDTEETP